MCERSVTFSIIVLAKRMGVEAGTLSKVTWRKSAELNDDIRTGAKVGPRASRMIWIGSKGKNRIGGKSATLRWRGNEQKRNLQAAIHGD